MPGLIPGQLCRGQLEDKFELTFKYHLLHKIPPKWNHSRLKVCEWKAIIRHFVAGIKLISETKNDEERDIILKTDVGIQARLNV